MKILLGVPVVEIYMQILEWNWDLLAGRKKERTVPYGGQNVSKQDADVTATQLFGSKCIKMNEKWMKDGRSFLSTSQFTMPSFVLLLSKFQTCTGVRLNWAAQSGRACDTLRLCGPRRLHTPTFLTRCLLYSRQVNTRRAVGLPYSTFQHPRVCSGSYAFSLPKPTGRNVFLEWKRTENKGEAIGCTPMPLDWQLLQT